VFKKILDDVAASIRIAKAPAYRVGIGLQDTNLLTAALAELKGHIPEQALDVAIYSSSGDFKVPGRVHVKSFRHDVPEKAIIEDFKAGKLDAIIRGQLSSVIFLKELKQQFSITNICRLALLSSSAGQDFFFAPVGIDEARNPGEKQRLIELATSMMHRLGITPSFYLLSAGRIDDAGRDEAIARSIRDTVDLVDRMKRLHEGLQIQHGEILIENAFAKGGNVIIAPDGVSGNLIYRTLLHLGNGHSHGAYYLNEELPPVVDTSRVGTAEEYAGAIVLALRLLGERKQQ